MTRLPPSGFVRTLVPARIAELGLSFDRPVDWVLPELPTEQQPDFADPLVFVSLAVAIAPYGAVVFSVGARPAFDDGSVAQWLAWLAREQGLDPSEVEPAKVGDRDGVACWAIQLADGTTMRSRLWMFEDGGRLVVVTSTAPDVLWSSVAPQFDTMLASFRLDAPRGATVPPFASSTTAAATPAAPPPPEDTDTATGADRADEAVLADDTSSLDPEHSTNAWLRDQGVGLVPRIASVDAATCRVRLAAGAILATFPLPFGWHAIDDGRRVLLFDPAGKVQIELRRVPRVGRSLAEWREAILTEALADAAGVEHVRFEVGELHCLGLRNLVIDGETLEQAFLLREAPDDTMLRARVTASPEQMRVALDVAGDAVLKSEVAHAGGPAADAWTAACALEAAGRIAEAEALLERSIDDLGVHGQIARLHELRMQRFLAAGDRQRAIDAFRRSTGRMRAMASQATSGGEGAALSQEAREHRQRLVAALGFDPDAQGAAESADGV